MNYTATHYVDRMTIALARPLGNADRARIAEVAGGRVNFPPRAHGHALIALYLPDDDTLRFLNAAPWWRPLSARIVRVEFAADFPCATYAEAIALSRRDRHPDRPEMAQRPRSPLPIDPLHPGPSVPPEPGRIRRYAMQAHRRSPRARRASGVERRRVPERRRPPADRPDRVRPPRALDRQRRAPRPSGPAAPRPLGPTPWQGETRRCIRGGIAPDRPGRRRWPPLLPGRRGPRRSRRRALPPLRASRRAGALECSAERREANRAQRSGESFPGRGVRGDPFVR